MSYHLSSKPTVARQKFSKDSWTKLLSLAMFYGWQPMGTQPPSRIELYNLDTEDWNGTYLTNEGQTVTAEDALSLAQALEKSLDDIPDFNSEMDQTAKSQEEDDLPEWLSPIERAIIEKGLKDHRLDLEVLSPFEYFAGDEKRHLINFIKFCRLGSFVILRI